MDQNTDWLEKGFQMAYYTVCNRMAAIEIVSNALEKLRVHVHREKKRSYWRHKHFRRPIRRITRQAGDLLQWLIMVDSEPFEKQEEQVNGPSADDFAVRYVKHLVRLTSATSSFHVNIALSRLLHSYSTSQTQTAYEMLTGRYPGADEYRRVKATLMAKINERFRNIVKTIRVEHGELRFETCRDQERWVDLINECLTLFTPWSTARSCNQLFPSDSDGVTSLVDDDGLHNEAEMNCCHIFIEPICYKRLITALGFDLPAKKLALPEFFVNNRPSHTAARRTPKLSPAERQGIIERQATRDARRRAISPRVITILVDGSECARFDLRQEPILEIEVEGGAQLIELREKDATGDLLLATFSIQYSGELFAFSKGILHLRRGKLEIIIWPKATIGDVARARIAFEYHVGTLISPVGNLRDLLKGLLTVIRRHAVPVLASFIVAIALTNLMVRSNKAPSLRDPALQTPGATASYVLVSDDERIRAGNGGGSNEVLLRPNLEVVNLELAMRNLPTFASYRADLKTFTESQEILSETVYQHQTPDDITMVTIHVPASLLQAGKYYTVRLMPPGPSGEPEDAARFTFQAVAQ